MSNCHSAQAEYDDHNFKNGLCTKCGAVDKPGIRDMAKRLEAAEATIARVRDLTHPDWVLSISARTKRTILETLDGPQ